ncbi:MAG: HisA/HisF family protein [Methanobrevibacter sp.]|uniref:HisA/HisF family protein n=1 Tax=Methanobrevibacter sp. TaxID=66852 RepID=UPI0026DED8CA|nr:HisA/HisF family protein [Methanobrevibacter sp.]MDO5849380.1 HisA/HisF family protein [Methanobrevibacter sp.]
MINKVPVLDLKDNVAVSGKSGQRQTYTPLKSVYATSSDPVEIANNLKLNGAKEVYVADLDLIDSNGHNLHQVKMMNTILPVIFDGGVKDFESYTFFLDYAYKVIVATETLESLDELQRIFEAFPKERIVLSIDIKDNKLYSKHLDVSLDKLKRILKYLDPSEIILLDISSVGTNKGFNKELLDEFEEFKDKLIIAGGINKESLKELEKEGIKKVLIGTSIHNGEISIL